MISMRKKYFYKISYVQSLLFFCFLYNISFSFIMKSISITYLNESVELWLYVIVLCYQGFSVNVLICRHEIRRILFTQNFLFYPTGYMVAICSSRPIVFFVVCVIWVQIDGLNPPHSSFWTDRYKFCRA